MKYKKVLGYQLGVKQPFFWKRRVGSYQRCIGKQLRGGGGGVAAFTRAVSACKSGKSVRARTKAGTYA